MNLNTVKNYIKSKKNIHLKFIYKCPRNKKEKFSGKIIGCYPSIFIVEDDNCVIRSFTYSDFIIKNLKIISK